MKMHIKKSVLALVLAHLVVGLTAITATIAAEPSSEDSKTVAWYVANIPEAKKQNKECHDNPNLQSTPNCINALHALEISFKGGN